MISYIFNEIYVIIKQVWVKWSKDFFNIWIKVNLNTTNNMSKNVQTI